MVLETLFRALGCRRVLLCLRDSSGQQLLGRMGLGRRDRDRAPLKLPLQGRTICSRWCAPRGVDTLISDASAPNVAQRLPAWYREHIAAPCFLLLPLQLKGAPLGLIYADTAAAGAIALGEQPLALVKTLLQPGDDGVSQTVKVRQVASPDGRCWWRLTLPGPGAAAPALAATWYLEGLHDPGLVLLHTVA